MGGEPLAWEQWVPRAAAAAAVPGAAAAAPSPITKRTLSAVAGPLLLVLEALEVKPAGNKYKAAKLWYPLRLARPSLYDTLRRRQPLKRSGL